MDQNDSTKARMAQIASVWNARALGLISEMDLKVEKAEAGGVEVRMPFNPDFCVDDEGTMLHGGILTALLDSAFGLANFLAIDNVATMATVDLRVEYLRPAQSRADVIVSAECYRQTRHVAFNSGRVWFDTPGLPEVARGFASFSIIRGETSMLDKLNTMGPGS
ncbi:MAG: phenylacetic acid degradation protein [Rhodobacteraceae bacterium]|nr:MAG: phenylacetic acid degradation protein [Paracoccaceae bacterium]